MPQSTNTGPTRALIVKDIAVILAKADVNAGNVLAALAEDSRGIGMPIVDQEGNVLTDHERELYVSNIRLAVQADMPAALNVIKKDSDQTGLSMMVAGRALEQLISLGDGDKIAWDLIEDRLSEVRIIELLMVFGDLDSSLSMIADQDMLFQAMVDEVFSPLSMLTDQDKLLQDMADEAPLPRIDIICYFRLLSWARKLKDREDWEEMLERTVPMTHETLDHEIHRAIFHLYANRDWTFPDYHDEDRVGTLSFSIPPDLYEECGVEVNADYLASLTEEAEDLDPDDVRLAREEHMRNRTKRKRALKEVGAVAVATAATKSEINF